MLPDRGLIIHAMPVAAAKKTQAVFVELEFDDRTRGSFGLADTGRVLTAIHGLLDDMGRISARPIVELMPEIEIVSMGMHSPLKVKISIIGMSKEGVQAVVNLLRDVVFFRQTRTRMAALAAKEWEEVAEKRLKNIEKALDLAMQADPATRKVTEQEALRIYRNMLTLEQVDMTLKRAEITEE